MHPVQRLNFPGSETRDAILDNVGQKPPQSSIETSRLAGCCCACARQATSLAKAASDET